MAQSQKYVFYQFTPVTLLQRIWSRVKCFTRLEKSESVLLVKRRRLRLAEHNDSCFKLLFYPSMIFACEPANHGLTSQHLRPGPVHEPRPSTPTSYRPPAPENYTCNRQCARQHIPGQLAFSLVASIRIFCGERLFTQSFSNSHSPRR